MICKNCGNKFVGRPNKKYCSPGCKRNAKKMRKKQREIETWMDSLSSQERAFFDAIPVFDTFHIEEFDSEAILQ